MKRIAYAALLVLAISVIVVMPAFAADACDPSMSMPELHEATVASLTAHVQHANQMGHIKTALMPALVVPLTAAANEGLPVSARSGALQIFIGRVNAQAGKGINADCAKELVKQAHDSIQALNG